MKYKAQIFERLSKGKFICSNAKEDRPLYDAVEEHLEQLQQDFGELNFLLEQGDGYFYFSRRENKAALDRKLKAAFKWIDYMDFFRTFNSSFSAGVHFSIAEIAGELKVNTALKEKLRIFSKGTASSELEMLQKLTTELVNEGFLAVEDGLESSYRVLSSWGYLEKLILKIDITEDLHHS
ncbi:condensin complex protein MksE [Persicobacter psychrovividus]|uniref:Uncharacterized protein n=1 Tax=Persicobacter psychrovividus TaxID=387638 RepID=A0ABM7VMA1_9BACT|nr:hypothetical protein PEPS_43860 [Persicobacter psychrovividus]